MLVIASVAVVLTLLTPRPAFADEGTHVGAGGSTFDTSANAAVASEDLAATSPTTVGAGHWVTTEVSCPQSLAGSCGGTRNCAGNKPAMQMDYVLEDGTVSQSSVICPEDLESRGPTLADIDHAFKQIPMKPSTIHIQPPGGETLVNFDTIYYTEPYSLDRSVRLLGSTVDFHITVASYIWHYGDGTTDTTTSPGAAYPDQTIVHRYLRKGPVEVSLETVYQADYSINGGPQQHLADTVTMTSAPQRLSILTATPHLVAD
jgi:hypothetical protein